MNYSFKIINSSAGSGKTFNLAVEFISKILSEKDPNHFKKMIALTFTNKASSEMKDRILQYLLELKNDNNESLKKIFLEKTGLEPGLIQKKSEMSLKRILDNYSDFNVLTIDSFTNDILKSFDFSNDQDTDYKIELDSSVIIDKVIDELFEDLKNDNYLKELFIQFSKFKIFNNKSWDISFDLKEFLLFLEKETNKFQIDFFKEKNEEYFINTREEAFNLLKKKKRDIKVYAKKCLNLFQEKKIQSEDFKGSYFPNFLASLINDDNIYYNNSIENALKGSTRLYNKSLNDDKVKIIEQIRPELLDNYNNIKKTVVDIKILNSLLLYLPILSIIPRVNQKINKIQKADNLKLISKFNYELNKLITSYDTPEIYEKLGSKYTDFFIDEFQDTSELQWKNLIPLISNSIHSEDHDGSKGSLLLVGDPKQSIYRWRGSRINQFINLIINENNPFHIDPIILNINTNYRSSNKIVEFNSEFFSFVCDKLNLNIYNTDLLNFKQKTSKKDDGYIEIHEYINDNFYIEIESKINDLLSRGFLPSDIAILVRKNNQITDLIENIKSENFELLSNDALNINTSSDVQFIISIFRLSISVNKIEKRNILKYLYNKNFFRDSYLNLNQCFLNNLSLEGLPDFFNNITKSKFDFKFFTNLDLIQSFVYCCKTFKLDIKNIYLKSLLDDIYEFNSDQKKSISEYLSHWEKKSDTIKLSLPDNNNSIITSTIHKSKGLEFQAVIMPFMNEKLDEANFNEILWLHEPIKELKNFQWLPIKKSKILIDGGSVTKDIYDSCVLNNLIDSVNLLYVGFTRPKKELYIFLENNNYSPTTYSSLIKDFLNLKKYDNKFILGNKTRIKKEEKKLIKNESNVKILAASKNVNQAIYVSETLKEILRVNKSANIFIYHFDKNFKTLIEVFDNLESPICSDIHFLESDKYNFDYVILTNLNEGLFPFYEINKSERIDNILLDFESLDNQSKEIRISNLFYKLIKNAKEVHLTYDTDLTSISNGEESRFIKQLKFLYLDNINVSMETLNDKIILNQEKNETIKIDEIIKNKIQDLFNDGISASTLNLFIKNPYLFYEQKILGINDNEETKYLNYMDQGTLIHKVIENIYTPYIDKVLEIDYLDKILEKIDEITDSTFFELYSKKPDGKNLIFVEIVKEYIKRIIEFERKIIKRDKVEIKILFVEKKLSSFIELNGEKVKIKGIIDRIDLLNGELRIIDYKSGLVNQKNLDINYLNSIPNDSKFSNLLQLLIYKLLVLNNFKEYKLKELGIYSFKKIDNQFLTIKDHYKVSIEEIKKIVSDILIEIIETNEFIDSGNPS